MVHHLKVHENIFGILNLISLNLTDPIFNFVHVLSEHDTIIIIIIIKQIRNSQWYTVNILNSMAVKIKTMCRSTSKC